MSKSNKKIQESKKIIKEEKKKIKLEKKSLKKKKNQQFKKTKFGRFLNKIFGLFSTDRNSYSFSEVFSITIISLILGAFSCFSVFTIFTGGRNYFKLSKDLDKFFDVYEVLVDNYNGDLDKEALVDEAINGMVSSVGDVYTSYNDADATSEFDEMVSGIYEGIGCAIQQMEDGVIKIVDVYENSPSLKAGLKKGDYILSVDELDAKDTSVNDMSEYIKNEADGTIEIVVLRGEEKLTFKLERAEVEIPVISTKTFDVNDKKIGYIAISIFSSVAAKQFENNLIKLEEEGIDGLVIDVRGNNGGYLTTVTDISSYLLPKGEVIYQIQKDKDKEITKDKTDTKREYPIAILTNGGSASASEILAGVIKESYSNGYVVGTKTYGKGTVQQVKKLSDGSMIKYTVENWLTPDGNWINEVGIEPTHKVEISEKYYKEPIDDNDNQLQKGLELVSK